MASDQDLLKRHLSVFNLAPQEEELLPQYEPIVTPDVPESTPDVEPTRVWIWQCECGGRREGTRDESPFAAHCNARRLG